MTPEQFCYWLQGWFEISELPTQLYPSQINKIKQHLNLVFEHIVKDNTDKPELISVVYKSGASC